MGLFISVMDQTGLNIAVPRIADAFNASIPTVQWVVLGYVLTISSLMLPMGRLADLIGRKRVYVTGFVVFTVGGILAGLSPNLGMVIAMKMVQGVGTALTQATGMAIVTSTFPNEERGRAIGLLMTIVGVGAIAGPVTGGFVIDAFGWRAIFLMAAPLGALSVLAGLLVLEGRASVNRQVTSSFRSFDYVGAMLSTAALVSFLLIMTFGYRIGWGSLAVVTGMALVIGLFSAFIFWERHVNDPMIPMELFRRPQFVLGASANFISFMASTALFFLMPFFLQEVKGYTPGESGLILVAPGICMAVIGPIAGRLSDRLGSRRFAVTGLAISVSAFLLFSRLDGSSSLLLIVIGLLLAGTGSALFFSPNSSSILGSVERERYGVATAFLNLIRNAGNITGLAIATTIVTMTMASMGFEPSLTAVTDANGNGVVHAFATGLNYAFLLSALMGTLALIMSAIKLKPPSPFATEAIVS